MRYARASRKSASLIRTSHGGKTRVACSATSVAVERTKIAIKPASTAPTRRSARRGAWLPDGGRSGIDHDLESAPEHALAVEWHRLRVHHLRQALVLHDLGHDAVAMRARLVHDVGEHHRLAGFQLDALRERRALARLHVIGRALVILERAVLAPDFSGKPRQAAIRRQLPLRYRYHDCVHVVHRILLGWLSKPTLSHLSQAATGEAALAARGKGGNASAIATAPRPIAAEPTYIQVYRPKVSKIQPPMAGPSAIPRLDTMAAAPNTAPRMRCPKYSRASTA